MRIALSQCPELYYLTQSFPLGAPFFDTVPEGPSCRGQDHEGPGHQR